MLVTYGMRHKLTLVRKGDDDAIYRNVAAAAGKVQLSKIAWLMPRVHASDTKKIELYRKIESKMAIDVGFGMRQCNVAEIPQNVTNFDWRLGVRSSPEKPRHILIAFQKDRNTGQTKNPSLFDNDITADFPRHKFAEYYGILWIGSSDCWKFCRDYHLQGRVCHLLL